MSAGARTAAAEEAHAVLLVGEGAKGEDLASRIAARLSAPYVAMNPEPLRQSLATARAPALAAAARAHTKDTSLVHRVRIGLRSAHAEQAVLLQVGRSKRAVSVHVWLVAAEGEGGATVDRDVSLSPGASAAEEAEAVRALLAPTLTSSPAAAAPTERASAALPSPAEPQSAPAPPPEKGPTPPPLDDRPSAPPPAPAERPPSTRLNALFAARASLGAGTRHFSYADRVTPELRGYDLGAAPVVAVDAGLFPFARTGVPVLADLGITGDYAMAFAVSSDDSSGAKVGTHWSAFDIGVRERIHLGPRAVIGLHGGYGQNDFTFDESSGAVRLPDVRYHFVRAGLDADVLISRLLLSVSASFLGVLSTGTVGTYFPRETARGVELGLAVAYPVGLGLEVSAELSYSRFFYSMNPEPGDANVAGGALDQMGRAALGVGYVF